jgi:hypothetical protein
VDDLVAFAHAALFSPVLSTLEKALQSNFLLNFPGLTTDTLRRHPPHSKAMVMGHLDQTRQGTRSTQRHAMAPAKNDGAESDDDHDAFPANEEPNERTHYCYAADIEITGQVYSDQTGRFVAPSDNGNQYLFVLYDYDSNSIHAEPMKNKTAKCILAAYKTVHQRLCTAGLKPQLQRLDNECSQILKDFMNQQHIDYQLVPPHVHRRNAAERAIRTFKNHFIAGLCSVDRDFPVHLWDRLLPQALLTLNLLRGSRINPKLSAYAQVHGTYDFNRTPIAPPGIRVLVHQKPSVRRSWAPHAIDGWYIGPALESYRCYRVWIWETRMERICDTLTWFPTKVKLPTVTNSDLILAGIQDIVNALTKPLPDNSLPPLDPTHVQALVDVSALLTRLLSPDARSLRVAEGAKKPRPSDTNQPSQPTPLQEIIDPTPTPTYATITAPPRRRSNRRQRATPSSPPPAPPSPMSPAAAQAPSTTHPIHAAAAYTVHQSHHQALHGTAINPDTGRVAEYPELSRCSDGHHWLKSNTDEIGRLAQGLGPNSHMPNGTDTIFFIPFHQIPKDRKATYIRVVCADRPEKPEPRRVRWTAGGNLVDYPGDVSTKTADITTVKILLNSVLSTPDARFMTIDLKDFYLNTPMERYEYVRIPLTLIPDTIMNLYNLDELVHKGAVYAEVRKGMYGLPQAGRIAYDRLKEFLAPHGYAPLAHTPGLWRDTNTNLVFSLVVDDFGVKFTDKRDADRLTATLQQLYKVSTDWDGQRYCGLTLEWDYAKRTCDISMPGYIERALQRFTHPPPTRPQHSPHAWTKPDYGAKMQYAIPADESPPLDAADTKRVQEILGTLLFYARAVDNTMLTAIGAIATQQSQGTQETMKAVVQLLNYCATHPNAVVRFHASDMVLWIESDASYLSEPKGRSRAGGFHYLSDRPASPPATEDTPPPINGPINVVCHIMREVLSSAAEAELGALFHNCKEACPIRTTLEELGHPQPQTPVQTDNSTASGIANDTVKQKRSKAIDMRFYWVRDRVRQKQFHIFWRKGSANKADYFTKHHPSSHHQQVRPTYLHEPHLNYYACLRDDDDDDDDDGATNPIIPYQPIKNTHVKFLDQELVSPTWGEGVLLPTSRYPTDGNRYSPDWTNSSISHKFT